MSQDGQQVLKSETNHEFSCLQAQIKTNSAKLIKFCAVERRWDVDI